MRLTNKDNKFEDCKYCIHEENKTACDECDVGEAFVPKDMPGVDQMGEGYDDDYSY